MRFKLDENLPPEAVPLFRDRGHDVITVWDEKLRGRPDHEVAEACQRESRAFVTLDTGFSDIRKYPPEEYSGFIVLRLKTQARSHVLSILERLEPMLMREPLVGSLWVADEQRVRIRHAPAESE